MSRIVEKVTKLILVLSFYPQIPYDLLCKAGGKATYFLINSCGIPKRSKLETSRLTLGSRSGGAFTKER